MFDQSAIAPFELVCESLANAFPETLFFCDASGTIQYPTDYGLKILKYAARDLQRKSLQDLTPPDFQTDILKNLLVPLAAGRSCNCLESRVQIGKGACVPVEIRTFFLPAAQNTEKTGFAIVRDMRKQKMDKLKMMEDAREAATGQLSSCIGHDVSNPLSVIKLYVEWLIEELEESLKETENPLLSNCLESIRNIGQSADRIESLVTQMRNFARSTEQMLMEADLKKIISDALDCLSQNLDNNNIRIETELPDGDCLAHVQPDQIYQVFVHLIRNCCEAFESHPRQKKPVVSINIQKTFDALHEPRVFQYDCTVTDNGPGIHEANKDLIFSPFFSTKKTTNAAGLGLSVVRNIIRRHGGDLQIQSALNGGTEVSFRIPAATKPLNGASVG